MLKSIICDTSCFIVLSKIGELELLQKIYKQIITTPDILEEYGKTLNEWVIIKEVTDNYRQHFRNANR